MKQPRCCLPRPGYLARLTGAVIAEGRPHPASSIRRASSSESLASVHFRLSPPAPRRLYHVCSSSDADVPRWLAAMASEMLSAEQANEHLFEKLIESLRETGILSSHHASSSFVVYAHDSTLSLDAAQPAHATTAKWIIRQLRSLYTRTLSDRYPAPLFESRADDHDSCHNIVANQACLIPGFQRLGGSGQIGTVDKAIICISPRLRLYLGTQFAKSYIKSVRAKCLEYQNCPREQIHVSMRRLVEESCEDPNFHHVLTEVGLLTAEKDNARQTPRTILLTFDSGPSEIPYFSKSDLQIVFPTHGVSKYASFFKLLRRLYEREASIIAIYEEAYKKNETTQDTEEAAFRAGVAGILYGIHNEIHMLSGHHSRQATNKHVTTIDVGHEFHSLGQRFEEQSRAQLAAFEAHADFNRQALLMLAKRSSDVERPADLTLETMQRLVARQDELQNGLAKRDQMQELLSASMPPTAPSRFECKCVPYKQTEAWEVQLGLSTVSLMRKRDFQHRPQCRYFKAATHRPKTSQSAKARITWFSKVLDIALTATYFRCQGAGGFSVSPRLAYHSMVDEMTSPSFRVLYTLQSYIAYARDRPKSFTEPLAAKVVDLALNKLQEIFRCRRASPTDVNSFNETLLHRFVNLVRCPISS
ncbi:uncharacterized protein B0I36DRAFT_23483 [Microdochium trichocladiopsis]|uniref:Uncharacterized protein n=1 Tax=Microdochium trichocladiopsis TaxID=1682393 RepID=A0A9P8YJA0_9PEZI|nr:uncharacterized protein B0I36DRAFT_23483 [Microdochium trichocladiopsis]KAH7041434.1 hypothetical protein B0I36DRAFT_23483 [Microdochium trichocladiopsis]